MLCSILGQMILAQTQNNSQPQEKNKDCLFFFYLYDLPTLICGPTNQIKQAAGSASIHTNQGRLQTQYHVTLVCIAIAFFSIKQSKITS